MGAAVMSRARRTLDLGCGGAKTPGAVGMDRLPLPGVDVVADLDAPCLPFAGETFDEIVMADALEHVADVRRALAESARILAEGGVITVRVPHFTSLHAYSDVTHRHFFSAEGVRRLMGAAPEPSPHLAVPGLVLTSLRIRMWRLWRLVGVEALANRFPTTYEKLFAFIFPAMSLEFRLTKQHKVY